MKLSLILIAFLSLGIIVQVAALASQNVGGDFGISWLQQHGTHPSPAENKTDLWRWGNAPKGYAIYNGQANPTRLYPLWYYPSLMANSTAFNGRYQDPWVLAEFTGQPVMIISISAGLLF